MEPKYAHTHETKPWQTWKITLPRSPSSRNVLPRPSIPKPGGNLPVNGTISANTRTTSSRIFRSPQKTPTSKTHRSSTAGRGGLTIRRQERFSSTSDPAGISRKSRGPLRPRW